MVIKILICVSLLGFLEVNAETKMVTIKGGVFTPLYGTKKEPIQVPDFELDQYPVTNQDFLEYVKVNTEWKKSNARKIFVDQSYLKHWQNDESLGAKALPMGPVVHVSWYAAKNYCESKGKRLPTVNEWEYVASLPIDGVDIKKLILDWYADLSPEVIPSVTTGKTNNSGVSSMHGLIWEWNLDFNSALITGESRADQTIDKTMYCGSGSQGAADPKDYAAFLRFGFRSSLKANYTVANLGFRCAKESSIKESSAKGK